MDISRRLFLLFLLLAISPVYGESLSLQWKNQTEKNQAEVTIYPQNGNYVIGRYHEWVMEVKKVATGEPYENLQIGISGGMVSHGHGLPSQPMVTRYLGDGRYLIEGVLFNMSGDWTLLFLLQHSTFKDKVRFDIQIGP